MCLKSRRPLSEKLLRLSFFHDSLHEECFIALERIDGCVVFFGRESLLFEPYVMFYVIIPVIGTSKNIQSNLRLLCEKFVCQWELRSSISLI